LLRSFFARYFNSSALPEELFLKIRELDHRGTLVYVAPAGNLLNFLYLNHICNQYRLPLAHFVEGVDPVWVQPMGLLFERLRIFSDENAHDVDDEKDRQAEKQLKATLSTGQASLLYLGHPSTIVNPHESIELHLLESLVGVQRESSKPIYLIPHLVRWNAHPTRQDKSVTDTIFGEAEAPGILRSLYHLFRNRKNALLKIAEPIDLKEFLKSCSPGSDALVAAALQDELQQVLGVETYTISGPRIRPHDEFCHEILGDQKIQSLIEAESKGNPIKAEALRKKAHDILDEIAAEPRIRWPLMLNKLLDFFWRRMYRGFIIDDEGFERIRKTLRDSPVVFCPCHKSHVDYLVMGQLCIKKSLPMPLTAAGVNLSFWPMGPIFRHSGAFFLRRSFDGDPLYPAVFRTYLRHVLDEGFPLEFFIEGTRSRTGKLLYPRFGILSWLVQACLDGAGQDLNFIPISIDYEKIVESKAYLRELTGGEKRKEDVSGLIKSGKALRTKYGKIYVQVSEPISVKACMADLGLDSLTLDEEQRRRLFQRLAYQILYEINRVSTTTPSAIAAFCLLNHCKRGMTHDEFLVQARWVLDWIRDRKARLSVSLKRFERALAEALARFSREGLVSIQDTGIKLVYSVVERKRLALDYYRNNLIHHFVPVGVATLALESFTVEAVPVDSLSERIRELSRLFKYEFLFCSGQQFEEELGQAIRLLQNAGAIREENGFVVKPSETSQLRRRHMAMMEHFVEAYWLTAVSLKRLRKRVHSEREFLSKALHYGDSLFVQGELVFHESLSREIMKNALKSFADRKVIEIYKEKGGKGFLLRLPVDLSCGSLQSLADEIVLFMNRSIGQKQTQI
jgi:glycerol-3-phosphate O-acyltransferase